MPEIRRVIARVTGGRPARRRWIRAAPAIALALVVGGAAVPAAADTPTPLPPPLITVTLPGITLPVTPTAPPPPPVDTLEATLLAKLNAERAAGGLGPLRLQPWAASVARAHSEEMAAARDIWHNHTGYLDIARRVIGAYLTGENVAEAGTLDETDSLLMNSPPHRSNILYPAFNYVGIGVALDAAGYVYVTQDFVTIRPAPATVVAARAPAAGPPAATAPAPLPAVATPIPAVVAATASPPPPPATPTPVPPPGPLAASPVAAIRPPPHPPATRWAVFLAALDGAFYAWFVRRTTRRRSAS